MIGLRIRQSLRLGKLLSMNKDNFLQVGRTNQCGNCHPEKFPDCKTIEQWKCDCICHDNMNPCCEKCSNIGVIDKKDWGCENPECLCHEIKPSELIKNQSGPDYVVSPNFKKVMDSVCCMGGCGNVNCEHCSPKQEPLSKYVFDLLSQSRLDVVREIKEKIKDEKIADTVDYGNVDPKEISPEEHRDLLIHAITFQEGWNKAIDRVANLLDETK